MIFEKTLINGTNACLYAYILDEQKRINKTNKRPAVIICPGGGYLLTSQKEGEPVALKFNTMGYHTFVLRYNTYFLEKPKKFLNEETLPTVNEKGIFPQQLYDLIQTILFIREHEEEWQIDVNQIILVGFSAGAHLCASLGVRWNDINLANKFNIKNEMIKPSAIILGYPLLDTTQIEKSIESSTDKNFINMMKYVKKALFNTETPTDEQITSISPVHLVNTDTSPTFIWHTADDNQTIVANSLNFANALSRVNVPFELHIFQSGVHGAALYDEVSASEPAHLNPACAQWINLAETWLKNIME
jgi:acetyl esterase/lipase